MRRTLKREQTLRTIAAYVEVAVKGRTLVRTVHIAAHVTLFLFLSGTCIPLAYGNDRTSEELRQLRLTPLFKELMARGEALKSFSNNDGDLFFVSTCPDEDWYCLKERIYLAKLQEDGWHLEDVTEVISQSPPPKGMPNYGKDIVPDETWVPFWYQGQLYFLVPLEPER